MAFNDDVFELTAIGMFDLLTTTTGSLLLFEYEPKIAPLALMRGADS